MPDWVAVAGVAVGVIGIASAYLSQRKLKAVANAAQAFAKVALCFYSLCPDGWTGPEKEELGEATIVFFNALKAAGIVLQEPA